MCEPSSSTSVPVAISASQNDLAAPPLSKIASEDVAIRYAEQSSSKSQNISPSQILPLPKRKTTTLRSSKRKASVILTSSAVKNKLEETEAMKLSKQSNKGKRNICGANIIKGSKSKEKQKQTTKTAFGKNIEKVLTNSEKNVTCPGCFEAYEETPNDEWIKCNQCEEWWHEDCSPYEGIGVFICDYCV